MVSEQCISTVVVPQRSRPPGSEDLLPEVYPGLRRMARFFLLRERSDHTLQPTALVHEAFLRMLEQRETTNDRAHYMALAAQMMRRILVNHALGKRAAKRGGGQAHIPLEDDLPVAAEEVRCVDVLALDQALEELATMDSRQSKIVELRYFAGLSIEETAETLGVSIATVKRDWLTARVWLRHRLSD